MEEKKLTDEEIIKAFEQCNIKGGSCKGCAYAVEAKGDIRCKMKQMRIDTLDLIHRLQSERDKWFNHSVELQEQINTLRLDENKQKAEIERLTEEKQAYIKDYEFVKNEYASALMTLGKEGEAKAELQKQVDELKAKNKSLGLKALTLRSENKMLVEMCNDCDTVKQAAEDTAKEILGEIYHGNYEIDIQVKDYEVHKEAIEIVVKAFLKCLNERIKSVAESKGVEVG